MGGSSGDVFWSPLHKTFLAVYFQGMPDNTFFIRYSLDGQVTGKWSEPQTLLVTTPSDDGEGKLTPFNYAGHSYPSWDPTGKTLMLSWTFGSYWIRMARVTWL